MRSRADLARAGGEWALRAVVILVLAVTLARALAARTHRGVEGATTASLDAALRAWSTARAPERVRIALDRAPLVRDRDWLAALQRAGTAVEWSGAALVPSAIAVEPRADPAGGVGVSVAAPPGARVELRDTAGVIDTLVADAGGRLRAVVSHAQATMDAAAGPVVSRGGARDSLRLRALLVLGAAEWETKFAAAALEERGWKIDARFALSPKGDVHQGAIGAIDTSRYSAVVAVDSTAAPYADQIAAYVRQGGGLVLWSAAARAPALARIAPGAPGTLVADDGSAPPDSAPRRGLALAPIERLAGDAVVIERRGRDVGLAARVVGGGRVIETGYVDSWRWRMAGGDGAPEAHRAWLAGLVAAVAYTGRTAVTPPPTDAAPLAMLVDRLGPATADASADAATAPAPLAGWILALLCAAALAEWLSRRLRGVK